MRDAGDLRWQLTVALGRADYPVESPLDLAPILPDGPETQYEVGETSAAAMAILVEADACEFPYEARDALVEDLLTAIEDEQTA